MWEIETGMNHRIFHACEWQESNVGNQYNLMGMIKNEKIPYLKCVNLSSCVHKQLQLLKSSCATEKQASRSLYGLPVLSVAYINTK